MMPITMAGIGEKCKIQKIGGNEETRRFLANLGFVNEAEVSIVSAIGGNVIVNIKVRQNSFARLLIISTNPELTATVTQFPSESSNLSSPGTIAQIILA